MNRITPYLVFLFTFQIQLSAQNLPLPAPVNLPLCGTDDLAKQWCDSDPAYEQELRLFFEEATPLLANRQRSAIEPLLSVSVVVHIIHSGEPVGQGSNLSEAQIKAQIEVLNHDYSALNPQFYNTPAQWAGIAGTPNIQFCLATKDPAGNPTNGITRHNIPITGTSYGDSNINSEIKPQTKWDPYRYFNIYVLAIPGTTAAGGVVGFSNYPTLSAVGSTTDGVTIDYRWFGSPGFPVSGYRALTHETGHYLGVRHPFHGNSCATDDGIADTPDIEKATIEYADLNCAGAVYPPAPVSCGNEHLYVNYMDYVNENCYTSFTNGQIALMRAVLEGTPNAFGYGSRLGLLQNAPLQCNLPAHDAGITRVLAPALVSCTGVPVEPQVTLRNFGVQHLTSSLIIYKINGGTPDTMLWQGNLFPGQNQAVTLNGYIPPDGVYTLSAYTARPNGVADQRPANDTIHQSLITYYAYQAPLFENFENESGFPTTDGVFDYDVTGDGFTWQLNQNYSAFGQGQASAMFDNFVSGANSPAGTLDALITRHYNFSNLPNPTLRFDVAYAPKSNQTDTLLVLVATGCSLNFNLLAYRKGGVSLATAPATNTPFAPAPTQWRTETVNLSAYGGMDDVTLAFVNLSGGGNRLFVDNIKLGAPCSSLNAATINVQHESFYNGKNGSATLSVPSGNSPYTYAWSNGATTQTVNNLPPGTYSVTITDLLGCTTVKQATILAFDCGGFALTTQVSHVTCHGEATGSVTAVAIGGNLPYSFLWNNGADSPSITGLVAGVYSVTATDAKLCPAVQTATVSQPTALSLIVQVSPQTAVGVNDGAANVVASGGTGSYQYLWSNGATTSNTGNLAPGSYSVTVTDANGCSATASATVLSVDCGGFLASIEGTDVTCFGMQNGTASVVATSNNPPLVLNWNNGAGTSSITGLGPGTYSVTVNDNAGCSSQLSIAVSQPSQLVLNVLVTHETAVGANNGTANVFASGGVPVGGGGYTYLWSTGSTASGIFNLPPGNYSVTVTDANLCTASQTVTVEGFDCAISVQTSASAASCTTVADGSAEVTTIMGGSAPFFYLWSNGSTSFFVNNLLPGNYTLTVSDATGCSAVVAVAVGDNDHTPPTAVTQNITVFLDENGSATIMPAQVDAGSFDLCSGVNLSLDKTQFTCANVGDNTVKLTVTDANGNAASAFAIVSVKNSLTIEYKVEMPTCYGASDGYINLLISGGTPPFVTLWSHGETPFNLKAGSYTVTVTDANGCSKAEAIAVGEPNPITITLVNTIPATNGQSNGVISFSIGGGTPPYGIVWLKNGVILSGFDPQHAAPGTYQALVTDSQGCKYLSEYITVENMTDAASVGAGSSFRLFPNPTHGLVYLQIDGSSLAAEVRVTVSDVTGRRISEVTQQLGAGNSLTLNLTTLPAGVYWLKIWTDDKQEMRWIVKAR